uniref:Uncharacterized protein n=1 Tax=Otus sunia TaxID=257818 RepID=A0A8C8ACZ8_9STRI
MISLLEVRICSSGSMLKSQNISVCFNPKGNCILTASSDKTARLWDAATGHCLQILEGHTDEIF